MAQTGGFAFEDDGQVPTSSSPTVTRRSRQPTTGSTPLYKTYTKNGRTFHRYPGGRTVELPAKDRTNGQHFSTGGGGGNPGGGTQSPLGGQGGAASDELRALFGLAGPSDPREIAGLARNQVELQLKPELDSIATARKQSQADYEYLNRVSNQYAQQSADAARGVDTSGFSQQGKDFFGQQQGVASLRGQENTRELLDSESAKLTDLASQEKTLNDKRGSMLVDAYNNLRQQTFTDYATAVGLSGNDIESQRTYRLGQQGLSADVAQSQIGAAADVAKQQNDVITSGAFAGYTKKQVAAHSGDWKDQRRSAFQKSTGGQSSVYSEGPFAGKSRSEIEAMSADQRQQLVDKFQSGKGGKTGGLTAKQQHDIKSQNAQLWSLIDAGARMFPDLRNTKADSGDYLTVGETLALLPGRVKGLDGGLAQIAMYVARARRGDVQAKLKAVRALQARGIPVPSELSTAAKNSPSERPAGGT